MARAPIAPELACRIRQTYSQLNNKSYRLVADLFGVSHETVFYLVNGRVRESRSQFKKLRKAVVLKCGHKVTIVPCMLCSTRAAAKNPGPARRHHGLAGRQLGGSRFDD